MDSHRYVILLAGGQGSRFWPQSRTLEPKQFLSLHADKSLFEQTIARVRPFVPVGNIFIATAQLYRSQILELAASYGIPESNLVFEPDGKNTAPSIGFCCAVIHSRDPQARISVLPCDHLIKNNPRFLSLLRAADKLGVQRLVIFGIRPTRPATGYGYIQVTRSPGHQVTKLSGHPAVAGYRRNPNSAGCQVTGQSLRVKRFTEKPDLKTAQRFLKSRDYYWNSGIFVGSSAVFLREYQKNLPGLYRLLRSVKQPDDIGRVWKHIEPVSFDYGILEKAAQVWMLAAEDLGWSDLGSWQAWDQISKKDGQGNLLKADTVTIDSRNITVVGGSRLVATIGLQDLIIVDTPDALLVTRKDRSEDVKKIVDTLKQRHRQEHYAHTTVKRPWGSYTLLQLGEGFKVKLVEVKPRKALSLQYHTKRSEHWVVVEGTAQITRAKKRALFHANESTYIPVGCCHRLANPSKDRILRIVEVQAGRYLEEDDIVRIKDDFGRT